MNKSTPVDRLRLGGKGDGQPTDPLSAADDGALTAFNGGSSLDGQFVASPFLASGADSGPPFVAASPALPSGSADIGAISGGPVLNASNLPAGFGNADAAVHGPQARSTYGVTGSGIKIGIISDAFNAISGDLSTAQADGAIGTYTIVKDDPSASTDEGLAMAEIVHSIAPGAQVYFYSGDFGESSFAQGITTLAQDGCQIICDDEFYLTEPFYQQGAPISAAIDNAVQQYGVTYFTAAGNEGPRSFYEGHFNSTTSVATTLPIGTNGAQQNVTAFNFGTSGSPTPYEKITVPYGLAGNYALIDLQWDQPFQSISGTGSAYSLQFYLFDANHKLVQDPPYGPVQGYGVSGNDPNGNDVGLDPVQWNYFPDPSGSGTAATYYLAITLNGGTIPVGQDQFKVIISNDSFTPIGFTGANAGVGSGTVFGHAADPNAISVGAVDYHRTPAFGVSPPQIEPFSSSGPGQTLINSSGQQLATPQSDGKVTVAAPDGNPTTLPSSEGLNPFYGTSAATPAAAAIAALMLQEDPALTPAQINSMLAQSAIAMGNSNVSGAGLVQADAAVGLAQNAKAPTVTAITASPSTGDLGIGKSVVLTLTMSAPVTVAGGAPTLSLNDNATANYDPGKSTSTSLVFDYTVAGTDASVASLVATLVNLPPGVTIKSATGSNANLSLASLAQAGPQIDTTLPTVTVAVNSTDVNLADSTATVTFTFSDAPTAFVLADTSATGGTLSNLQGSGTSYTATFTAANNTDIGNATVAVAAGSWQKANGNPGQGGSTNPFIVDTVTPTVAVSINSTDVNVANPTGKVTFTFSEAPTNFSLADASATGGTLSNLTGSGTSYTATFTGAANTDIANATVAVTAGSWQEGNGNPGGGGSTAPFTVDTVTPTISSITANPANAALNAGKSVTLSVTFSEVETVGGLTPATTPFLTLNDLGTATYTGGSGTNVLTFGYTVAAGQNTPDLAGTGLNLNGATIQDGGGNNADLSGAVTNPAGTLKIDTTPPTVTGVVSSPATGEATTGQLVSISLNMSEAVTVPGMVVLLLNDGAIANYDKSKSTATTAVFDYTVASSQVTTDLVVSGVGLASTSANTDLAGNATNFAGAGANLGLQVNTTATGNAGPSGGNFSLPGTAVLDLFGPSRASVTFAAGSTGTLELFDSQAFTGTIAGLAHGNHLDLADIGFGAGTKLGYTPNSGNTGGTLSITDGTHTANLALLGSYVAANFTMSSDGNGGTMVVDPPIGSPMNSQGLAPAHQ